MAGLHPEAALAGIRRVVAEANSERISFTDDRARLIDDPEHSEYEDLFVLMGLSHSVRVLLVCQCYRFESGVVRIISARRASRAELSFIDR